MPHICCWLVAKLLSWHFCNPRDCSPPGSSVHGIFQARILEWVAISFSRESSQPRDQTCVSWIGRQILYCWATGEAHIPNVFMWKTYLLFIWNSTSPRHPASLFAKSGNPDHPVHQNNLERDPKNCLEKLFGKLFGKSEKEKFKKPPPPSSLHTWTPECCDPPTPTPTPFPGRIQCLRSGESVFHESFPAGKELRTRFHHHCSITKPPREPGRSSGSTARSWGFRTQMIAFLKTPYCIYPNCYISSHLRI